VGIDGIILIPCISLKEEAEMIGAAAQTAENFLVPKRFPSGSFWRLNFIPSILAFSDSILPGKWD
jgi:hypothetical protein